MPMDIDYEKIGLKVGLEIHQQLNTGAKLFCSCKPGLFKDQPEITFVRRLRPTQSELGQVDPAAFFEFQKGVRIRYEANHSTSCLVEMDEEPPHPLNAEAVKAVLTAALTMKAEPVDEIHVMRKTVIDGSNTTGFQRTCVVALGGGITVGEKVVPIEHISLEEDAARKTGQEGSLLQFRIDRLGIPLIEVATAPVMKTPKQVEEVAYTIGRIIRATKYAMRGLGTIRQDLNVSITNGALIEVKGVQELEMLSLVVEFEVQRQLSLIKTCEELIQRGITKENLHEDFADVTPLFSETKCKVIRKALDSHQLVMAVKLTGFAGLLKQELMPDFRLGTEMADRARFWGRVGGIFHSDEMPAYGVTVEEVDELRKMMEVEARDAVVFVADTQENCVDALRAVVERAREALEGVPSETRTAVEDGTTRYMRPRPGAARMYPETDIPPVRVTDELIAQVRSYLPEMPERKLQRLKKEYCLNEKLASQILTSEHSDLFETIVKETKVSATTAAAFLTETLTSLKRDKIDLENVDEDTLLEIFKLVGSGRLAKEAMSDVIVWLSEHGGSDVQSAIADLGLQAISEEDAEKLVEKVITDNMHLIQERKEGSFGPLMGTIMKTSRGKVDAALVGRLLREKLKETLR
jgi:glutamyl-tRNA(Gln) amidotransferase subunit E